MLLQQIFGDPKAPSAFMAAMKDISFFEREKEKQKPIPSSQSEEELRKQNAFEEGFLLSEEATLLIPSAKKNLPVEAENFYFVQDCFTQPEQMYRA